MRARLARSFLLGRLTRRRSLSVLVRFCPTGQIFQNVRQLPGRQVGELLGPEGFGKHHHHSPPSACHFVRQVIGREILSASRRLDRRTLRDRLGGPFGRRCRRRIAKTGTQRGLGHTERIVAKHGHGERKQRRLGITERAHFTTKVHGQFLEHAFNLPAIRSTSWRPSRHRHLPWKVRQQMQFGLAVAVASCNWMVTRRSVSSSPSSWVTRTRCSNTRPVLIAPTYTGSSWVSKAGWHAAEPRRRLFCGKYRTETASCRSSGRPSTSPLVPRFPARDPVVRVLWVWASSQGNRSTTIFKAGSSTANAWPGKAAPGNPAAASDDDQFPQGDCRRGCGADSRATAMAGRCQACG